MAPRNLAFALTLLAIGFSSAPLWAHGGGDHGNHGSDSGATGAGHTGSGHTGSGHTGPGAGQTPNYLFPDIVPFVEEDEIYLQNWDISGGEIRLETVYANFGDGLFEIRSGTNIGGGQIEVLQRVYIDDDFGDNYEDFVIDSAISNHGHHGHIHFEDFSRFSIHEMTVEDGVIGIGDEVASSLKTSYALSANRGPLRPEYVGFPRYTSSNNGIQQRISVGYGDRYSRTTEGQHFSIAGLPTDQLYWLRQHVDPDNNVMETDETNNMFEILIDLNHEGEALLRSDNGEFLQPGDLLSLLPGIAGDFNNDDLVNGEDWLLFVDNLGAVGASEMDMNNDGSVGYADFILFQQAFDAAQAAQLHTSHGASAPEPSTLVLLAAFCAIYCTICRRNGSSISRTQV